MSESPMIRIPEPRASTRAMLRPPLITPYVQILVAAALLALGSIRPAAAQTTPAGTASIDTPAPIDPYETVHEGNRLLKSGDAAKALELYDRAESVKPDAREIAFAQGLGHYALGDYEAARDAFQKAAGAKNDALADDALYSAGTTYHAEALAHADQPKLALENLESAMQRYQSVLAERPDHTAASDANLKAATMWRQMKQRLEQQQQQQQDQGENQEENQEQQDQQDKQEKKEKQQQNESKKQDEQESSEQKQEEQQQSSEKDQQQNQQQDQDQQKESSSEQEQESQSEQSSEAIEQREERVSKEQAERKLREMMQAIRERKENRREPVRFVPVRPVDKDW